MQGQEIGATNSYHSDISEIVDVESVNYYKMNKGKIPEEEMIEAINFGGRDNPRHLIPWDETPPKKAWIAPYSRQAEINVKADLAAEKSVFGFYQKLIALRKAEPCLRGGRYELIALTDEYYAYERTLDETKITIVCNFDKAYAFDGADGELLLSNYPSVGKALLPYQVAIYKK